MFRVTTTDARGRTVRFVPITLTPLGFGDGMIPRRSIAKARSALAATSGSMTLGWRALAFSMIPALVCFAPFWIHFAWDGTASLWLLLPATVITIPVAWWLMGRLSVWALNDDQRRTLAAALAEQGYCASCGYAMTGVTPVDDECTCPECGAAWPMAPDRGESASTAPRVP